MRVLNRRRNGGKRSWMRREKSLGKRRSSLLTGIINVRSILRRLRIRIRKMLRGIFKMMGVCCYSRVIMFRWWRLGLRRLREVNKRIEMR